MEVDSSFLHGKSGPPLESNRWYQEVYMLLIKLSDKLFTVQSLLWHDCLSANMLDFILGEVQSSSYSPVRSKLPWLDGWLGCSESDQKCSCAECRHLFRSHSLIFHFIIAWSNDYTVYNNCNFVIRTSFSKFVVIISILIKNYSKVINPTAFSFW